MGLRSDCLAGCSKNKISKPAKLSLMLLLDPGQDSPGG